MTDHLTDARRSLEGAKAARGDLESVSCSLIGLLALQLHAAETTDHLQAAQADAQLADAALVRVLDYAALLAADGATAYPAATIARAIRDVVEAP